MNEKPDFDNELVVRLPLGVALFLWHVITDKLGDIPIQDLERVEKLAVWALEDRLEAELIEAGVTKLPAAAWDDLILQVKEYVTHTEGRNA